MMGTALTLEPFDGAGYTSSGVEDLSEPAAQYDEGYAAGLAAAEEGFATAQAVLRSELITALQDALTDLNASRAQFLAALQPLHDTLLNTLLPEMLAPALYAQVRSLVAEAAQSNLSTPLIVNVHPGTTEVFDAVLADIAMDGMSVVEDPTLGPHDARVVSPDQETALDIDAAFAAIRANMEALSTIADLENEESRHGRHSL